MSPAIKYTLARVGMFVVLTVLLRLVFQLDLFLAMVIALCVTAVLAYFVLRKWRDEMAVTIEKSMSQRKQEKQRLRAALSGEEEPDK
jgi:positive regulator of sigma E activity